MPPLSTSHHEVFMNYAHTPLVVFQSDRMFEIRDGILDEMAVLDKEKCMGWQIIPGCRVPITVGGKYFDQAIVVTEWNNCALPLAGGDMPKEDDWEWRRALASASNRAARMEHADEPNWAFWGILLLAAVLAIIALVALAQSDMVGNLFGG